MGGRPNEFPPAPPVRPTYVPPSGVVHPVANGDTWGKIAAAHHMNPVDLIEFNFPGTKAVFSIDRERATRIVNWYLREYVGCNQTNDGANWAFSSGLTSGVGVWKGGRIYTPATPPPTPPVPPVDPNAVCNPTTSGKLGRRPTMYRLLSPQERQLAATVFGNSLPAWDTIGIGNGLGFDGRPWTDTRGGANWPELPHMWFQINMGDAAYSDLTSRSRLGGCLVSGISGSVADLLIHELVHVWQYHHKTKSFAFFAGDERFSVWISSLAGSYNFSAGKAWKDYDVEQQASIVEKWFHDGASATDQLYPYIRLVLQSGNLGEDGLDYASGRTLSELTGDLAGMRAHGVR